MSLTLDHFMFPVKPLLVIVLLIFLLLLIPLFKTSSSLPSEYLSKMQNQF